MKLQKPFTIADCRLPIGEKSSARAASVSNRPTAQGMALIITLIMLAVTLVMAVAFLALARRERAAVSTTTDTTTANFATSAGLAAAQSQIMANLLNTNSFKTLGNGLYNFNLIVSTNFINGFGYDDVLGTNVINVNYSYSDKAGFPPLTPPEYLQNIANLQLLPRVPVFVVTNTAGSNDFRYYLDLNRNGFFEDSGFVPNVVNNGGVITTNGFISAVGDPQWIGMLARPDTMHSPNNQFVSRYAFLAQPIGNTLDINFIHNEGATPLVGSFSLGGGNYRRNQGVGAWELNLAAFFTDLNTNTYAWDAPSYGYNFAGGGVGVGFSNAAAIYAYRLNGGVNVSTYTTAVLPSAQSVLKNAANVFGYDRIDAYSDGPLQTSNSLSSVLPDNDLSVIAQPWPGASVTNRYTDLSEDLFDLNSTKTTTSLANRLINSATNASTYDRYTYYRLLSQLGTDSDPDAGKMNLNYSNVLINYDINGVVTNMTIIPGAETNLVPWTATNFFMAAADRMLRFYTTNWFTANPSNYLATYYGVNTQYRYSNINDDFVTNSPTGFGLTNFTLLGVVGNGFLDLTNQIPAFGITNIPVYVNGQFVYSPAVNRLLQMAANLYDESTTNFYPSVFKPLFEQDQVGDVFIVGFRQVRSVIGMNDAELNAPYDISQLYDAFSHGASPAPMIDSGAGINVYGVPWIIGAKKGFPNFNKFGMQSIVQATRKLQVHRSFIPTLANPGTPLFLTNQLLAFSISNNINAECWNSYANAYPYPVQVYALDTLSMWITNDAGAPATFFNNSQITNGFVVNPWPGYNSISPAISFTNALSAVATLLTNCDFYFGSSPPGVSGFYSDSLAYGWETNRFDLKFPHFGVLTTNRLQLYMLDTSGPPGLNHVIDYVHFAGPQPALDISAALETNNPAAPGYGPNMWSQAVDANGALIGIKSQILASEQPITPNATLANGALYWANIATNQAQIDAFAAFMGKTPPYGSDQSGATNYVAQVPFTPTATISQYTSWQANDPLVHYLSSDLNYFGTEKINGNPAVPTGVQAQYGQIGSIVYYPVFNAVNDRYQPWGVVAPVKYQTTGYNFTNAYNLIYKDPLIYNSDSWDLPTNVYPTVGWIGRVHRGTPWQTVYLKAHNILDGTPVGTNTWLAWTGDYDAFDAANSAPLQDRMLFDLFTTRFNDNAARGTLSVNVGAGSSDPSSGLAAWSALFSGMVAITNIVPYQVLSLNRIPTNDWSIIPPAGVFGLNSYVGTLVANINSARTNFTGADGVKGSFEHVGDILSAVKLTEQSPYLNLSNTNQLRYGISDEAYEWLPQQMMGLVRESHTPRYVVYAYGQALRPAVNGLVTSGNYFGLATNYQVVAESAVRAVVSVRQTVTSSATGPVTNYTTQVENYTVLPPY